MSKASAHALLHDLWKAALAVLLVLLALEALERGFVSRFFDLNALVLSLFLLSVILLLTRPRRHAGSPAPAGALQAVGIAAALAVWSFLPEAVGPAMRALAAGGVLLLSVLSYPIIRNP